MDLLLEFFAEFVFCFITCDSLPTKLGPPAARTAESSAPVPAHVHQGTLMDEYIYIYTLGLQSYLLKGTWTLHTYITEPPITF